MYYLGVTLLVLAIELIGVGALTGVLYLYWNYFANRNQQKK